MAEDGTGTLDLKPQKVTDLDIAFPADVMHLMPPYMDIPAKFRHGRTEWNQFMSDWFYHGITSISKLEPKEGIDKKEAFRHIKCIMGSFQPKHEHKEASVAYLLDSWFEPGVVYEVKKRDA